MRKPSAFLMIWHKKYWNAGLLKCKKRLIVDLLFYYSSQTHTRFGTLGEG